MISQTFFKISAVATLQVFIKKLKNSDLLILICLLALSIIYLLYYYRMGGIKDREIESPTLRDVGVYLDTGRQVLARQNPYSGVFSQDGTVARSWPFGPTVLTILAGWIPIKLITPIFQFLNILGVFSFAYLIAHKIRIQQLVLIFILIVWSSPTREMLVTNQITGIVMGLISIPVIVFRQKWLKLKSFFLYPLLAFPMSIAIDLKPHIALGLLAALVYFEKMVRVFLVAVAELLIFHIFINIYHGKILEIDWFLFVNNLNNLGAKNQLGDSVSYWPLLHNYFDFDFDNRLISYPLISVLGILFLFLIRKGHYISAISTITFLPSLTFYFHFYDAIPLLTILFYVVVKERINPLNLAIVGFLMIPSQITNVKNLFFVICILSLLIYLKRDREEVIQLTTLGALILIAIHLARNAVDSDLRINQSFIVSTSMLFSYLTICAHRIIIFKRESKSNSL